MFGECNLTTKTLILGGVRSGKSRLAERLAIDSGLPVTYLATAEANDQEMHQRIAAHRIRRPEHWTVIEEPLALAATLSKHNTAHQCMIVDCLTLWLTNCLMADNSEVLDNQRQALLSVLPTFAGKIILVSNETNMGITPMGELSRRYCDEAGRLHQDLAGICDRVILTVAGLPQVLKGASLG